MVKKFVFLILAAICFNAFAGGSEYVVNGSFKGSSVQGWHLYPNTMYVTYCGDAFCDASPGPNFGGISQTIVGAHGSAALSFDLALTEGIEMVIWNGSVLATLSGTSPLQHYTYSVAASGNDVLAFRGISGPSHNKLTNVSLLAAVPEPETWAMMLSGLGLLAFLSRRHRKA